MYDHALGRSQNRFELLCIPRDNETGPAKCYANFGRKCLNFDTVVRKHFHLDATIYFPDSINFAPPHSAYVVVRYL